jgi:hypothetical protein
MPPAVAIGSDGAFYLSAPFDELPIQDIPGDRGFFLGVATSEHAPFADALVEFLERKEPRVLGFDGRVYVESAHGPDAQPNEARLFYGYAATEDESEQIRDLLGMIGMEVFSSLESRPRKAKG